MPTAIPFGLIRQELKHSSTFRFRIHSPSRTTKKTSDVFRDKKIKLSQTSLSQTLKSFSCFDEHKFVPVKDQ